MSSKLRIKIYNPTGTDIIPLEHKDALDLIKDKVNEGYLLYLGTNHIANVDDLTEEDLESADNISLGFAIMGG